MYEPYMTKGAKAKATGPVDEKNEEIRFAVRYLYDMQRFRIQVGGRGGQKEAGKKVDLKPGDIGFLDSLARELSHLETQAERHVGKLIKDHPVMPWLASVKGVGPRMAGVILSEVDIRRSETTSGLWRYCGMATVPAKDGQGRVAERREKGVKLAYNSFLKTKMLGVLAESFIKANSPYRRYYDDYKTRKENTLLPVCMGCKGTKKVAGAKCSNCNGTGGPAPWGRSKNHRHTAAKRYMVKMFLAQLYIEWRTVEGLPVRAPYAQEFLGRSHTPKPSDVGASG